MIELDDIIENCKTIILGFRSSEHIESLYIGGSIKPEDRTRDSDIDIIGIVDDSFPENDETEINKKLKESISVMKCKLRVLFMSELSGGKPKSYISSLLPVRLFLRRIPSFPLIWGDRLDIGKTIGPYTYEEEIQVQTRLIMDFIARQNDPVKPRPFEWIPKAVLYLSALESAFFCENEYTTSFSEVCNQWMKKKDHIVHNCITIRKAGYDIPEKEKEDFINKVTRYLEILNVKISGGKKDRINIRAV